ncbi:hypothetical protein IWX81_001934 [Salinibacterium sp. CAN_S4]|uniref:hypothetical protein n=1 Tax=Salinibacterium sp. CAN_S4 TaxID=2787727 RepID=UPI0018EF9F9B
MADDNELDDNEPEFEPLAEARDVEPVRERGQGLRLGVSLVLAGLALGAIVAVGTIVVGGFAQTEAGLCRITWAPCTELSLGSVTALSGVDLPEGAEVVSGFSRESEQSPEFRAEVTIPDGALFTLSTEYGELDGNQPDLVPAVEGADITGVRYWLRFEQPGGAIAAAAQGFDQQGRTVILFDTHPVD